MTEIKIKHVPENNSRPLASIIEKNTGAWPSGVIDYKPLVSFEMWNLSSDDQYYSKK